MERFNGTCWHCGRKKLDVNSNTVLISTAFCKGEKSRKKTTKKKKKKKTKQNATNILKAFSEQYTEHIAFRLNFTFVNSQKVI